MFAQVRATALRFDLCFVSDPQMNLGVMHGQHLRCCLEREAGLLDSKFCERCKGIRPSLWLTKGVILGVAKRTSIGRKSSFSDLSECERSNFGIY